MKRGSIVLLTFLLACSSSDPNQPDERDRPRPQMRRAVPVEAGTDVLPPPRWWRDRRIARPLKLTDEQFEQLEAIDKREASDLQRLRREAMLTARDFENALDADPPSTADIVAAGEHLSLKREALLDVEVKRVAAERAVLSRDQWRTLQDELHTESMARYERARRPPWIYPGWGPPRRWPGWGWPWY